MDWEKTISQYYQMGLYSAEQVKVFVPNYITQQQCESIINKA